MTLNEILLLIISITCLLVYMTETIFISFPRLVSVSYMNLFFIVSIVSILIYFMIYNYHIHLALLNAVMWSILGKEVKKAINLNNMEQNMSK